jgi:O-antigen ligase
MKTPVLGVPPGMPALDSVAHEAALTVRRDRVRSVLATAGWLGVILPLSVVLLSAAFSPASNWTVRTIVAGLCILAVARPDAGLLITIALIGFGIILSLLAGVPSLRATEVLVLASLFGCVGRGFAPGTPLRRALSASVSAPIALFAIAVIASTIVWQRVYQFETGYASEYVVALMRFVSRDYFTQPGDFWVLVSGAVILEGLALYVVVAALCQVDSTFFERALRMLTIGGSGLAVMSVVRLAEILLRNPDAIAALRATSNGLRISPQIPDYIAAGSYFSLCWLIALGLAIAKPRSRLVWVAASVPLIAGLYLTGSRSVIAAALIGVVALIFMLVRHRAAAARGVIVFALLVVVIMVVSYRWMIGRDAIGEMAGQSLTVRIELLRTGLRVISTRPLLGIGLDRFFLLAAGLASPELRALWSGRMNPHNDFLRFGAELGLIGLGLFLWILAAAARRVWGALKSHHDARLMGLAAGVIAFLVTSLVSNPLMVRDVSYVFWIALGLAAGQAARLQPDAAAGAVTPGLVGPRKGISRLQPWIAALVGGLLVLSVPFRASKELAGVDPRGVSYGFFDWGVDEDGTPFRWTGPRATLFVDGRARFVEIPVGGATAAGRLQYVEIRIDGQLVNRIAVGPERQRVRVLLPASTGAVRRRIDLTVSPSWVPAEMFPGSLDKRVHGVKVGPITVTMNPRGGT